ncbi:ORF6N domain [Mycoplasmopsis citelli]|uniref:ORF6N domain n=1 Tax=Mycoplasmopsis citelli TaxID=171281 RepID=A0A449B210_9BACT|nr:ORF6N domain-containing protein [Mycoplasmopsis citelli]VEU74616.1 ORF6N domain [Mycoplasmopsis citelli]
MENSKNILEIDDQNIKNMIFTIRDKQVMIDRDLASLYHVTTKRLNEQVKRNYLRFPEEFCFQLDNEEKKELVANCDRFSSLKHSTSNPYVFTEQGITMLSAVLNSDIAIQMSIKIIKSFVEMRNFLIANKEIFSRLDRVELKLLETDKRMDEVFDYLANQKEVKQKIFFNGQIYDAFSFIIKIIQKAKKEIILIDNYVDINSLNILRNKNKEVNVVIITSGKGKLSAKDTDKFNLQYPNLIVKINNNFHDRFLILDDADVYHIGASIKDAGKKSFAISKIEEKDLIESLINKINQIDI